jgi:hypothetical protein
MTSPPRSQPMTGSLSTEVDLVLWVQLEPKEAADHITSLKARIVALEVALEKVRSYNVDIAAGRINYRPHDHIQVIDEALYPESAK